MKVVLPWLVCWARRAGTIDFLSCLGCSSQASTNYNLPHRKLFPFFSPHRPQPGQAVVLGRLSLFLRTLPLFPVFLLWPPVYWNRFQETR
jgi:hypothetical protein